MGCGSLPAPGVPRDLAEQRAKIREVRYDLSFTIRPDEPVRGTSVVRFVLETPGDVVLDFRGRLTSGQRHENGHIFLADLRAGEHAVPFEFVAEDRPLNRNPEYLYTLFVPARASEVFPCFDQPDLKARFSLKLDVPEGWTWVWNGTNEPISTYLFAFAAGKFQVETSGSMRLFHRETDREKVERNRAAIFELHERARKWLEEYTGIPYPFGKFDFVLLPAFQYNGMEHPGSIFYRSAALFLEKTATQEQELDRANVISHETAHMWFGDLVTMRWFDDVWMKEVFANFLAAKIVNPSFPKMNHELRFLMAHYPAAYAVDRSAGTHPIRRPLGNLLEAGSLYGAIIYKKAPIVLRELERAIGEEKFREGVREYLRKFRFGNAGWPDLVAILQCEDWSRRWIESAGMPVNGDTPYGFVEREVGDPSTIADAFARGVEWIHAYESLVRGRVKGDAFLDLVLRCLPAETEDLIVNRVLGYLDRAYWIFTDRTRTIDLWPLLEKAPTRSLKAAYFSAIRGLTRESDRLKGIWDGKEIPGLPLAEADYMALALDLRVRGVDVLQEQLGRIQDPDRRARFEFEMRAFDDGFFESLEDPKNRAQEPWVIEALSYLHHPLRAPESLIRPALDMMEEVRRTGDVFFPERWAAAVLSGHSTKSAADLVRRFLRETRMDPRLREKVLQAADLLLRAHSD